MVKRVRTEANIKAEQKYYQKIEQFNLKLKPDDPVLMWLKTEAERRKIPILQLIRETLNKAAED